MRDFEKVEKAKELIEKQAFLVGAALNAGKGMLGFAAKSPLKAMGIGFSAMEAGAAGSQASKRVGQTFVGVPPPGNM